ncbi:MAG: T9SS type A sorting domain-containing protein [Saprospiraceae bacterium]|nr:T9SS type A sorting domain-containing protein [Saprospiraceae bacterium]
MLNGVSQELSRNIPVIIGNTDAAVQAIEKNDTVFLLTITFCHPLQVNGDCMGIMAIDRLGNPFWNQIIDSSPYLWLSPNGRTMDLRGDSLFLAGMIWKDSLYEVRMLCYLTDGDSLYHRDFSFSYTKQFFLRGAGLYGDEYILFGEIETEEGKFAFLWRFDLAFNLIAQHQYGDPDGVKNVVNLVSSEKGGFLLVYEEDLKGVFDQVVISRLDADFQVVDSFIGFPQERRGVYGLNVTETIDKGYLISWQKDVTYIYPHDTFPYPPAIYKLDSTFQLDWEVFFASKEVKELSKTFTHPDGGLVGVGVSDYWYHHDKTPPYPGPNAWFFRLEENGNVLWERALIDTTNAYGGRIWDGILDEESLILVGDLWTWNPTGQPFLDDPDVWFLTLDKDGCWNGDCGNYIVINTDTTTAIHPPVVGELLALQIYPNPTRAMVTLEWPKNAASANRMVRIYGVTGQLVLEQTLHAPRSVLSIQGYPPGTYFLQHIVDGAIIEVRSIILQP